jgi:hypothetical protein
MTARGSSRFARPLVGVLVVALLMGVAFMAWGALRDGNGGAGVGGAVSDPRSLQVDWVVGEDVTVAGEVVENTADACREPVEPNTCIADAGNSLVLDVGGGRVAVAYSYGEWPPCDNVEAAQAAHDLAVGAVVEVDARVEQVDPVVLSTCESPAYGFRRQ